MNLLIVTQKVDKNDPILGFFHGWIREFSQYFDSTKVICLEQKYFDLPEDIQVFSLGKEKRQSRLRYVALFMWYIWKHRNEYDAVFVHMNQEYVLLGGLLWRLLGKKVGMWRNHHAGSFLTAIAVALCSKVFCTSRYSFTAKYKKTVLMPVGIDTAMFNEKNIVQKTPNSILFMARISPVKKPHILIRALTVLKKKYKIVCTIVGDPLEKDKNYYSDLQKTVRETSLSDCIHFKKGIPNHESVDVYSAHDIFVNLSSSGMYDKTIFEAMMCGCLTVSCNKNLERKIDHIFLFKEDDVLDLGQKLDFLMSLSETEKRKHRDVLKAFAKEHHSLSTLAKKLYTELV